jgi:hypothetical protein
MLIPGLAVTGETDVNVRTVSVKEGGSAKTIVHEGVGTKNFTSKSFVIDG